MMKFSIHSQRKLDYEEKNYLDIIDPIHDFIRVYEHELSIIDNPIFQRLRRIRQLSGAHLTYPASAYKI